MTAEELIAAHIEARGGLQRIKDIERYARAARLR